MTEATQQTKRWEGQIVDGIFPLKKFLGETDHSAVFLTEYREGELKKAAIKLIAADPATAETKLSEWRTAAQLSHPNLLRVWRTGRCKLDGEELLYLVMEYAEENLADILPERPLTPEETRDMLSPVLGALGYLHSKGYVHGSLKPANILASGDQLKISSDAIARIGEAKSVPKRPGVYDPPEAISGMLTPASDVWSLGTTLVEVLTQRVPEWQPGPQREPLVPANLPAPFLEIARQCLRLEPHRRIGIADVAARLDAKVVVASAAAVGAGGSIAAVTLPAPMAPAAKAIVSQPIPARPRARPQPSQARGHAYGEARRKPRYIVPLIVGALVFAVILTIPRLLRRGPATAAVPTARGDSSGHSAAQKAAPSVAAVNPEKKSAQVNEVRQAPGTVSAANEKAARPSAQTPGADSLKSTEETPQPTAAAVTASASSSAVPAKPAAARKGAGGAKGEVLDQVLPDVSPKARDTIHGRVRVGVKVHVDAAGAVTDAQLDSPGPSKYFADLAQKAARRWAFTPPEVDGKSVESDWMLRFVFTQKDTKVTSTQITP
jgi:eukaryotic-like serine/threonine-protein kinase